MMDVMNDIWRLYINRKFEPIRNRFSSIKDEHIPYFFNLGTVLDPNNKRQAVLINSSGEPGHMTVGGGYRDAATEEQWKQAKELLEFRDKIYQEFVSDMLDKLI